MIRLISDSTCDLSAELRERYSVEILPLDIIMDGKAYQDGVDVTQQEIFDWSDRTKQTPKTAVFSAEQVKRRFRPILENGDEIICFGISAAMSASVQVMRLAVEELKAADRIHVIDSANLSTGVGLLICAAGDMIAEGKLSAAEIVGKIEALKPAVRASFVVDTMTFLHRGGRCGGVTALMGTALKIHPEIEVKDGKMQPRKKYRGAMHHVLMQYTEDLVPAMRKAMPKRVFITHSLCPAEWAAEIRDRIASLGVFEEILETNAGCVVSSHCGPRTLGILFIDGE